MGITGVGLYRPDAFLVPQLTASKYKTIITRASAD